LRHLHLASGVSDAQLLERFSTQRDEAAFELLVWRHGGMVLRTCRRLLRDAHEAEDAFQATFLALARRADSVGRGSVGGWLYRVAARVALRARTRRARWEACEQPTGGRDRPTRWRKRGGGRTAGSWTTRSTGCRRSTGWRSCCAAWRATAALRPPVRW